MIRAVKKFVFKARLDVFKTLQFRYQANFK